MTKTIALPEIIDATETPPKIREIYLVVENIECIAPAYDKLEHCTIKTTAGRSYEIALPAKEVAALANNNQAISLPDNLSKSNALAASMYNSLLNRHSHKHGQPLEGEVDTLAVLGKKVYETWAQEMDHSNVQKAPVGLGNLDEGESMQWDYPEVSLADVVPKETYVAIESDKGIKLYTLAGYNMAGHPNKTAVSSALLNRYKASAQRLNLPVCLRLRVVEAPSPFTIRADSGWLFSDYTVDGKQLEYALSSTMMYKKKDDHQIIDVKQTTPESLVEGHVYAMLRLENVVMQTLAYSFFELSLPLPEDPEEQETWSEDIKRHIFLTGDVLKKGEIIESLTFVTFSHYEDIDVNNDGEPRYVFRDYNEEWHMYSHAPAYMSRSGFRLIDEKRTVTGTRSEPRRVTLRELDPAKATLMIRARHQPGKPVIFMQFEDSLESLLPQTKSIVDKYQVELWDYDTWTWITPEGVWKDTVRFDFTTGVNNIRGTLDTVTGVVTYYDDTGQPC